MSSIGCEICESGNRQKTLQNAAELVAKLLKERGWGINHIRRHHDWSGKNCPRIFYDDGKWGGWAAFKGMVSEMLKAEVKVSPPVQTRVLVNGNPVEYIEKDGRIYVQLKSLGEVLGAKVEWDANTKTASLNI